MGRKLLIGGLGAALLLAGTLVGVSYGGGGRDRRARGDRVDPQHLWE